MNNNNNNNINTTVGYRSNKGSTVLDGLVSRYTCLSERPNNYNNKKRYLVSLRVYGNREVEDDDEPQSSLPNNSKFIYLCCYN